MAECSGEPEHQSALARFVGPYFMSYGEPVQNILCAHLYCMEPGPGTRAVRCRKGCVATYSCFFQAMQQVVMLAFN